MNFFESYHAKQLWSLSAIILTLIIFVPYIVSIHRGNTKPHVFSWVIWGIGTITVFFAQMSDDAGVGAVPIGISGIITSYIALLAFFKRTDIQITNSDWLFLIAALLALPFWFFTSNPKWAVIILTIVDVIGFAPTIRKAYYFPKDESIAFFLMSGLRNLLVVFALEHYSLTTALFPATVGLACALLAILIFVRRKHLTKV